MTRGDICLVTLDPPHGHEQHGHEQQGHEQQGTRPVLVVSPDAFNRVTRVPIVLPITSGGALARNPGFAVSLSGTRTTGFVRCDQPQPIDLAARNGRRLESVAAEIMDEVLARVATLFQ